MLDEGVANFYYANFAQFIISILFENRRTNGERCVQAHARRVKKKRFAYEDCTRKRKQKFEIAKSDLALPNQSVMFTMVPINGLSFMK